MNSYLLFTYRPYIFYKNNYYYLQPASILLSSTRNGIIIIVNYIQYYSLFHNNNIIIVIEYWLNRIIKDINCNLYIYAVNNISRIVFTRSFFIEIICNFKNYWLFINIYWMLIHKIVYSFFYKNQIVWNY